MSITINQELIEKEFRPKVLEMKWEQKREYSYLFFELWME